MTKAHVLVSYHGASGERRPRSGWQVVCVLNVKHSQIVDTR